MINATPYAALAVPMIDARGADVVVALIKATFEVLPGGRIAPSDEPAPIRMADEPHDVSRPTSSLRFATDLGVGKPGADVLVVGDAVSPKPVSTFDVAIKVRDLTASLRVHGPRVYYQGLTGLALSPAAAVERVAIVYEKAYGGALDDLSLIELQNPSGTGLAKDPRELWDRPAPQLEDPARPYRVGDRPAPAGFGPIPPHWHPRLGYAGTFDDAWMSDRMPLQPLDYDPRYEHTANPSLALGAPLVEGDLVAAIGMSEGLFSFALPRLGVRIHGKRDDGERVTLAPHLDTLILFPEEGRFELVGRAVLPMGRGRTLLREVRADVDA